jgi:hypothetical protein
MVFVLMLEAWSRRARALSLVRILMGAIGHADEDIYTILLAGRIVEVQQKRTLIFGGILGLDRLHDEASLMWLVAQILDERSIIRDSAADHHLPSHIWQSRIARRNKTKRVTLGLGWRCGLHSATVTNDCEGEFS